MVQTILIVDDEVEHVRMLEALLKDRGYKVLTAFDGDEAFEKAVRYRPDLIILDIMMPRMPGTDAASLLRSDERTKAIPVFFVTAVVSHSDEMPSISRPYRMFAKPVKFLELLDAIIKVGV